MSAIRLATLGRLEATRSGAVRPLGIQPKRLALLAYLTVTTTRSPQPRDAALALFWPALQGEEARRALRQALFYLRRIIGREMIVGSPDGSITVGPHAVWCDAVAFDEAVQAGQASEALGLYGGDFLAGVEVSDAAPAWHEWVLESRGRFRLQARDAAWQLAAAAETAGDLGAAAGWLRRAVAVAPEDPAALQRLAGLIAPDRGSAARVVTGQVEGRGPGPALPPEDSARRRPTTGARAGIIGVLAVVVLTAGLFRLRQSPSAPPVVLIDAFSGTDSALGWGVTEMARQAVARFPALRSAAPPDGGNSTRAGALITGGVSRVGVGYVLTAQAVTTPDGDLIAAIRDTARDSAALAAALDSLAAKVDRQLRPSHR